MYSENLPFTVFNVGICFKKADQNTRSKFSINSQNQELLLIEAKTMGIESIMVLSTCNRTEITAFTHDPKKLICLLTKYSKGTIEEFNKVATIYKNQEVINHFFKLGVGLDSQILGDYEIVGQLKKAFQNTKKHSCSNHFIERLINGVLQANKEAKNNTQFCTGITSVSYAAVQFIKDYYKGDANKNILIYGLGSMGKSTCKNILKYYPNNRICVVNRNHQKSIAFQKKHPAIEITQHHELTNEIASSDVLIVCTASSEPTITTKHFSNKGHKLILDVSIPNNVSTLVKDLEHIKLIGLDELSKKTIKTMEIRNKEIFKVNEIIEKHKKIYYKWVKHRQLIPALNELKANLEIIKKDEIVYQSKNIKDFNPQQAEIIASRMIQKLSSKYIKHLRSEDIAANESINMIRKIFTNDPLIKD